MATNCDIEEFVEIAFDELIKFYGETDLEAYIASKLLHENLTDIKLDPVELYGKMADGKKYLRLRVTGCIEVKEDEDGEKHPPAP